MATTIMDLLMATAMGNEMTIAVYKSKIILLRIIWISLYLKMKYMQSTHLCLIYLDLMCMLFYIYLSSIRLD